MPGGLGRGVGWGQQEHRRLKLDGEHGGLQGLCQADTYHRSPLSSLLVLTFQASTQFFPWGRASPCNGWRRGLLTQIILGRRGQPNADPGPREGLGGQPRRVGVICLGSRKQSKGQNLQKLHFLQWTLLTNAPSSHPSGLFLKI